MTEWKKFTSFCCDCRSLKAALEMMWVLHLNKIDRSATDYISVHHLGLILEQLASSGISAPCVWQRGYCMFLWQVSLLFCLCSSSLGNFHVLQSSNKFGDRSFFVCAPKYFVSWSVKIRNTHQQNPVKSAITVRIIRNLFLPFLLVSQSIAILLTWWYIFSPNSGYI